MKVCRDVRVVIAILKQRYIRNSLEQNLICCCQHLFWDMIRRSDIFFLFDELKAIVSIAKRSMNPELLD